ncbi:MAG: zf-TFIIB domain-containing protein, partial [Candidatus Eremiobacteraeota bacterium]|nr:zf-TFIIB domain-containing protein [Candidatus Eremiobacteraeota bacterium]
DRDARLRLIDFGLAKSMDERGTRNIVKGIGEHGFAPLEQGAYSKTDERSDLYSLGATLYYLLTKEIPPSATQRALASSDPLRDPREFNKTVQEETWNALQKMMALRATERPANVAEVRAIFPEPVGATDSGLRVCVSCKIPLVVEVLDGVEIDRCEECGGLWLDKGELEQLRSEFEAYEERTEELIRTISLTPDGPERELLQKERDESRPLWESITRLFRFGRS